WKASAIPFDCPMERWTDWYPQLPGARRADRSSCSVPTEWGPEVILRGSNPQERMSALGQKRTFTHLRPMSALPPKADIRYRDQFCEKHPVSVPQLIQTSAGRIKAAGRAFTIAMTEFGQRTIRPNRQGAHQLEFRHDDPTRMMTRAEGGL